MQDFKCPQCSGELSYLEGQPFVICDYCGSKAVLPNMPTIVRKIVVELGDHREITVRGETIKVSPYVGDQDLDEQAELLDEMFRLISIGEFEEAKKLVYIVDRKINIYNSGFIALQRVGMTMIKFKFKTEEDILKRTRPINDENLAYIIKGASLFADKIAAYNQRVITQNKKQMLEKVNQEASKYFGNKSSDDFGRYQNSVAIYAEDFSKTHDVTDVYFSKDDEQMSSRKEPEDYKDFMIPNEEVFDFFSMFENDG